ncbi:MFS transporter [Actinomycetospora sp. NBRC 106378]|uniref:MFS transporter n=1 Tax=Actinomycetospora sp. NBRC 106378 TaxID=3032208 RepID=UPI002553CB16|nr:MFS transporter [Actinomycetospora sp. NBRC 106378]
MFVSDEQQSLRGAWLALTGLSAVFLVEMLDNSVLTVALPTIGRDLAASTAGLQWVTGAYSVVFGGLMLVFGAAADRFGRRRLMTVGLVLLGLASLATAAVTTAPELVAVRATMGAAAAMTAPGAGALAFRLFDDEGLRVRAITLISTVGLVGLAIGPTLGGLVLAVAPWQVLLLVNVPVAVLAIVAVRRGIAADDPADLHRVPLDLPGAALGTATVVLALVAPTLFVESGARSPWPWVAATAAVLAAVGFVVRQRAARHPLLDLGLVARPLVSGGLAYKAAAGLATAGLGYLVTLQLQFAWGWPPAAAALGMLPQVAVLLATGPLVNPLVQRVGIHRAAGLGAGAIVVGLALYTALGTATYVGVALALALVAAGLRVAGVVAMVNVLQGLPANRTTIGAALSDTATEITSGTGVALAGTVIAALFTGTITATAWSPAQSAEFHGAALLAGTLLTVLAAAMTGWAMLRTRRVVSPEPVGAAA